MTQEGPRLERLLRRLSECPSEFIDTCQRPQGYVQVTALLCDYFRPHKLKDHDPFWEQLRSNRTKYKKPENYFAILAVAVWLVGEEWFVEHKETVEPMWKWLSGDSLVTLANLVKASDCIIDPDRREELARSCLTALGLRPSGETEAQANDRRMTLDSVERHRVLLATQAAEKRAREVREAMARKQALESASRYGE